MKIQGYNFYWCFPFDRDPYGATWLKNVFMRPAFLWINGKWVNEDSEERQNAVNSEEKK